jgi:uncharacterized repeat protein (TIGR03803 family)
MNKMLIKGSMVLSMLALFSAAAHAQIYTPLYELGTHSGDPAYPQGVFAQGRDGNLYSTSSAGGAHANGAVFQLTPSGTMKVLYSFPYPSPSQPAGGLTLGTDGNLYGTTPNGGPSNSGTVFMITTGGIPKVLHNFNGTTEGSVPQIAPIQGTDGNFYGTASNSGIAGQFGTIYKMTPAGGMTPLFEFTGAYAAPNLRYPTVLLQATDGNFYGITPGGQNAAGMVYRITPQGNLSVLHAFPFGGSPTDGAGPTDLVQGSDGNFYGTTRYGGPSGHGTIFKMSPTGTPYTILQYSQANFPGLEPQSLVQATDGKFYGGTYGDVACSGTYGLLFQMTSSGAYTDLFCKFYNGSANGIHPDDPLLQHTNGTFYSATYEGGGNTCVSCFGVLYSLKMGLGPFVTFLPAQSVGKVGKTIGILGQGFNGATKVSFNGAAASFTIASDTYLTATVPNGAKTGPITVTTAGSTLKSNKNFRVTPQITSFSPISGPVGTVVTITGISLSQTTKVTFGGMKATSFTVVNDKTVTATVPSGAVTGKIAVTTAGGSATSATAFTVP